MLTRLGNPVGTTMIFRPLASVVSVARKGRTSGAGAAAREASSSAPAARTVVRGICMAVASLAIWFWRVRRHDPPHTDFATHSQSREQLSRASGGAPRHLLIDPGSNHVEHLAP